MKIAPIRDTDRLAPVTLDITSGRDLHQIARAVLAHAAARPDLVFDDLLTLVAVQIHDGACYLAATDRRTLGVIRRPLPEGSPASEGSIHIDAAGLRKVLRTIASRDTIRVHLDRDGLTIANGQLTHRLPATDTYHPFPDWRAFLGRQLHTTTPARPADWTDLGPVHLKPPFLARFSHASNGEPLQVWRNPDPHAPLLITCADHFIGALMPVRLTGNHATDSLAAWRADCPAPVPAAA